MNLLRQFKGGVPLAVVALVIIALVFFALGRLTSHAMATTPAPTATATRILPTATPNLVLRSPHVLATFMLPNPGTAGPCETCNSLSFTANGPFDMIASCNPFGIFADAEPSYQLQLFNGNGHLLDTIKHSCGNPNDDKVATVVVPETLPAGQYQLQLDTSYTAPMSVLLLDASPQ